ncbi:MAG: transcription antitermination factor NusB [Aerococcus sp.]|nr:transcription antitermination factor NusB [Aerococcus sp.]
MRLGLAQIREIALLTLYQRWYNTESSIHDTFTFVTENSDLFQPVVTFSTVDTVEAIPRVSAERVEDVDSQQLKSALNGAVSHENDTVPEYLLTLVNGVEGKRDEIDAILDRFIEGKWSVNRLERINRLILEIAVYEICYGEEGKVPHVVAVDQALTLCKLYSDQRSRRFINGVLSKIIEEL